jgi:hypothetical protein
LIVQWGLQMARIGLALTKSNVIALTTDLISGTEHARKLKRFKKKRKLKTTDGKKNIVIGGSWYRAFMIRQGDKIQAG